MTHSPEAFERVLSAMADGKSLREACKVEGNPAVTTVLRRLAEDETFRLQYARAREAGDDAMAEDIQDIADTEVDPQKARVRIDARKWLLSKRQPKRYGDKLELAGDKDNPVAIAVVERRIVRPNAVNPDS